MSQTNYNSWLHRFAVLTALATLALLGVGGLVTSHGVGMAVPDWPNTYGYNLFLFPVSQWVGGVFYEHSHRLIAAFVGLLTTILSAWLWVRETRGQSGWLGLAAILLQRCSQRLSRWSQSRWLGVAAILLQRCSQWLSKQSQSRWLGLAAILLVLALLGVRKQPVYVGLAALAPVVMAFGFYQFSRSPLQLRWLGVVALAAVILQGVLGGLRVVLYKDELGIFHAALAQLFFVLVCALALLTSRWWKSLPSSLTSRPADGRGEQQTDATRQLGRLLLVTTALILSQLILGATMRHQHAGLAIPDFPLAYGKVWPAMDANSIATYNARRIETTAANPITAFQVGLQMVHRLMAVGIVICVVTVAWRARRVGAQLRRLSSLWLGLILLQVMLGAWTVWSNKAADVATAHVLVGALSLVTGTLGCIIAFRRSTGPVEATALASSSLGATHSDSFTGNPAAVLNH